MTSLEIKEKIKVLNQQYEKSITENIGRFILNPEISKITKEIADLQDQCVHSFVNDKCEFCGYELEVSDCK